MCRTCASYHTANKSMGVKLAPKRVELEMRFLALPIYSFCFEFFKDGLGYLVLS
jgi:hypothetical protein